MHIGFIKQLVSPGSGFQGRTDVPVESLNVVATPYLNSGAMRRFADMPAANLVLNFDHLEPSGYLHERYGGITPRISYIPAHGGVKLRVVRFEPRCTPFFTILIAPGQNDPVENHARLAFMLNRLGAEVFVYDARSQGYSGRTAGLQHIDTCHKYDHLWDLKFVANEVVRPNVAHTRTGRLAIVGFSMGALHMLVGLARGDITADYAVAVAPAIEPVDLPLGNFKAACTSLWLRNTRDIKGKEHIRPPEGWDFSRAPLSREFYETNPYTDDRQQLDMVWERMQLKGDMLRHGWPTKRRVADMYELRRIALALPAGAIKTPLTLLNGEGEHDGVIYTKPAKDFCYKTAANLKEDIDLPVRHAVNLAPHEQLGRLVAIITSFQPHRYPWKRSARPLASLENAA